MRSLFDYLSLVLCTLLPVCGFSQDTLEGQPKRKYQLEFSAGVFTYHPFKAKLGYYHLGGGINFPGKKPNRYTNFSLNLNRYGNLNVYTDYHTLTIGRHRQWVRGHFYGSLGINAGFFVAYSYYPHYQWWSMGIGLFPRGELGWSGEKMVICVGVYLSVGGGYFNYPDWYKPFGHDHSWFRRYSSAGSPYLKILLK
jgi:hypothetical protein